MRISTSRAWVAATYLVLGAVNGQGSGQDAASPINPGGVKPGAEDGEFFEPSEFNGSLGDNAAIFLVQSPLPIVFNWKTPSYEEVDTIQLWQIIQGKIKLGVDEPILIASRKVVPLGDGNQLAGTTPSTTLDTMVKGPGPSEPFTPGRSMARRQPQADCDGFLYGQHYGGGGNVTLDLFELKKECKRLRGNNPLYFRAIWGTRNERSSYSRAFAVLLDTVDLKEAKNNPIYTTTSPYNPPNSGQGSGIGFNNEETPVPNQAPPDVGSIPTNGLPATTSAPRTGLELGAIIGIAVGCGLAGLLVVLGIIWFVVRRRQRKQDLPVGSFNSDNRGDELMAEKEAHTGVNVDASPNSPYSDDGHPNGAYPPGTAVTTVAAAAAAVPPRQDQSRSYTPYSDRPGAAAGSAPSIRTDSIAQNDEGARANAPSPIPGRATPRGLTTPYAHLVEEGMTEEEIRRLEEEERQLDAAIEQAGRR
ncbi:hypothetical protein QBC36DRAFT_323847 [Triangularia setosa]|uniref:Mid2 domain-containing protein n=1 Tax=Triangularia setosa TaxID=2587417 RepID=A0AAN7AAU6_9PEZI|nr:hypothetical protein QBC36DRAFT_323847 [Podospora setosa]